MGVLALLEAAVEAAVEAAEEAAESPAWLLLLLLLLLLPECGLLGVLYSASASGASGGGWVALCRLGFVKSSSASPG